MGNNGLSISIMTLRSKSFKKFMLASIIYRFYCVMPPNAMPNVSFKSVQTSIRLPNGFFMNMQNIKSHIGVFLPSNSQYWNRACSVICHHNA